MSTITNLQAELEELEKRIKAISTAQSTLSQLMAISEYFDQVQAYLQDLNTMYESHIIECEEYSTRILTLETQMQKIQEQIANIGGASDVDLDEINANIQIISNELSELKNGSTTTIAQIDTALEDMQTEHQSMQEDILVNTTNISTINESIASMQTTINNLTSTQNSLTSSQSNLTSTVSSINTRLTNAENNISTLTGGVDLTEYENRLSAVENTNYMWHNYAYKKYEFFDAEPDNFTLFTREYYYACSPNVNVCQDIKLNYTTTCEGTMAVTFLSNFEEQETITINLAQNPNGYTIKRQIWPTLEANNIIIKCVATGMVKYNSIEITMHGKGLYIFNDYKDVRILYFDGYIYVTRAYNDGIRFGKFTSEDEIDLENLPNFKAYNDIDGCYSYIIYTPFPKSQGSTLTFTDKRDDTFLKMCINDNYLFASYVGDESTTTTRYVKNGSKARGNDFLPFVYGNYGIPLITNSAISIRDIEYGGTLDLTDINLPSVTEWLYCTIANYNHTSMAEKYVSIHKIGIVAYGNDGYWYLLKNRQNPTIKQICKGGIDATAYMQQDGTFHVYICFGNYVKKFKIYTTTTNYDTCDLIETITNCNCVLELLNNKRVKNTLSGWVLETVAEDATE